MSSYFSTIDACRSDPVEQIDVFDGKLFTPRPLDLQGASEKGLTQTVRVPIIPFKYDIVNITHQGSYSQSLLPGPLVFREFLYKLIFSAPRIGKVWDPLHKSLVIGLILWDPLQLQ